MPGLRAAADHTVIEKQLAQIPQLFGAAQPSASSHRRSVAALLKSLTICAQYTTEDGKHVRLTGEKEFMLAFRGCLDHILDVKKGILQADRVVKFVVAFFAHANEQREKAKVEGGDVEEDGEEEETPASRLATAILKHVLKGCGAANKHVRFRCTQVAAQLISVMPEIDVDLFELLKTALLVRANDKESPVRVQAVIGLAKLQGAEEEDGGEAAVETPTQTLVRLIAQDPSADVRRAALFHLDLTDSSLLPCVLSRTRDVDINNRRFIFQAKLAEVPHTAIPADARLRLLKHGLKDREEAVRRSAGKLLAKWVEDDLLGFINGFDVVQDGSPDDLKTVEEAIKSVLTHRMDIGGMLDFDDKFWSDITPASAFLARVAIEHYNSIGESNRVEEMLPTATVLATRMESQWKRIQIYAPDADAEARIGTTFVLDQLLKLALFCDYSDEAGRRKMMDGFMDVQDQREGGVRAMIMDPRLPLTVIPSCFDLLCKLLPQDSAFMQVVIETVHWLQESHGIAEEPQKPSADLERDSDSEQDEADDAEVEDLLTTPQRTASKPQNPAPRQSLPLDDEKIAAHLRCLTMIKCLLERVSASVQGSPILQKGLLNEIIVPAVQIKNEAIRAVGITCLGLCALLDRHTAVESFGLFVGQAVSTEGEMQENVYKIIFDILILNGLDFLLERKNHGPELIIDFISQGLEQEPAIQAISAVGISKLMLAGLLTDEEVLRKLAIVYFAPETIDNNDLRQCLSYFFPVYCYSSPLNQRRMQKILISTLDTLVHAYEDADDVEGLALPNQMAFQLIDWVDPTKAIEKEGQTNDTIIQADLAMDLLKEIFKRDSKDDRKRLVQLLGRLHLPPDLDEWKIRSMLLLIAKVQEDRPLGDSVSRNALSRFATLVARTYGERAEVLDDDDIKDVERFNQIAVWVEEEAAARAELEESKPAKPKRRSTAPKKRGRSKSRAISEDSIEDEEVPPMPDISNLPPRRSTRRRTSAVNKEESSAVQAQVSKLLELAGLSDSDEGLENVDEEEEEEDDI